MSSASRPGVTATTREGYYLQCGAPRVNPQNPSRRVMFDLTAAENNGMMYDAVPFTLMPVAGKPDEFVARIEPRGMIWSYATDMEMRKAELILRVSTFAKKGKELKRDARSIKLAAPRTDAPTGRIELGADLPVKVEHN